MEERLYRSVPLMKLFSAFWTQDPAFLFCTVFCTLGRWLSSQFFMSFNPWQCPKEKCSDLQSLFHPLEIPTGCVFPKSAKVTGVQILGFLWGVHFAWLNRVHQPPLLSLDPPIYLLLSMGEGRVGGNGRYAPTPPKYPILVSGEKELYHCSAFLLGDFFWIFL